MEHVFDGTDCEEGDWEMRGGNILGVRWSIRKWLHGQFAETSKDEEGVFLADVSERSVRIW